MIFRNEKGQVIASLNEGILRSDVEKSKHFMRIYKSWGIDKNVIDSIKNSCKIIEIYDRENDIVYKVSYAKFVEKSFEGKNFGHGRQLFLKENLFDKFQEKAGA